MGALNTRRSTPSFAIGGVSWLDHDNEPGDATEPPAAGWRCFHCNEHFTYWGAAGRHFGLPGSKAPAACVSRLKELEAENARLAILAVKGAPVLLQLTGEEQNALYDYVRSLKAGAQL